MDNYTSAWQFINPILNSVYNQLLTSWTGNISESPNIWFALRAITAVSHSHLILFFNPNTLSLSLPHQTTNDCREIQEQWWWLFSSTKMVIFYEKKTKFRREVKKLQLHRWEILLILTKKDKKMPTAGKTVLWFTANRPWSLYSAWQFIKAIIPLLGQSCFTKLSHKPIIPVLFGCEFSSMGTTQTPINF